MTDSPDKPNKTRIIIGYILTALPSAMLIFSGVMKLLKDDFMIQNMEHLKLLDVMQFIGILEIFIVIIYWIPRTMNLGFFLLCSYVGGIITAELIATSGQSIPVPGVPIAVLLYVGTFLRKKELSGLNL